jgi:thiamine biosynthesis lipoprotein
MDRLLSISLLISLILISAFQNLSPRHSTKKIYTLSGYAQGTSFNIRYAADSNLISKEEINQVLQVLDSSLSLYKPFSLITQFNFSKSGIQTDKHLASVVKKAHEISDETNGAFDITIKPLLSLWGFHQQNQSQIPRIEKIKATKMHVGYQKLSWNGTMLSKNDPFVQLDCDGIAQGYSVDQLAALFNDKGINDYQIELGGEVFVKGKMPDDQFWKTRLDMLSASSQLNEKLLMLDNEAITTSGSFSKFSKLGNTYFGHIIDPEKGRPVQNGIISVSVIARDATTADALDNAFMVMGIDKSMHYALDKTKIGLYIIYRTPQGSLKDTANPYFRSKINPSAEALPRWQ